MTLERGNIRQWHLATGLLFLLAVTTLLATVAIAVAEPSERHRPARLSFSSDRHGYVDPPQALKADDAAWNHGASNNWGIDG